MTAFNRRVTRDALELVQAAGQDDRDRAVEVVTRSEPAALAWTLAIVAATVISAHGSLDQFVEAALADVQREEDDERALVQHITKSWPRYGTEPW